MSTKINVLQVIPKLGYGGAETGCYDIAHYLAEKECGSFIVTSGGELLRFVKKEKVKINRIFKVLRLKRSLEKNAIIELDDIELVELSNSSQKSFFSHKKELVGRKLKKNLKTGQLLHPRHLYKKFEVSSGDVISIVSNIGNASVTVSGEAQGSGNLGDLIRVKNLRSGKIIRGYIKKNKIIKIFR